MILRHDGLQISSVEQPEPDVIRTMNRAKILKLFAQQGGEVVKGLRTKTAVKYLMDVISNKKWTQNARNIYGTLDVKKPLFGLKATTKQLKKWDSILEFVKKNPPAYMTDEIKELIGSGQHQFCDKEYCSKSRNGMPIAILTRTSIWQEWQTRICDQDWLRRLVVKYSSNINESAHNVAWKYAPK